MNPEFDLSLMNSLKCFHEDVFSTGTAASDKSNSENSAALTNASNVEEQLRTVSLSEIHPPIGHQSVLPRNPHIAPSSMEPRKRHFSGTTTPTKSHLLVNEEGLVFRNQHQDEQNENCLNVNKRIPREFAPYQAASLDDIEPIAKRGNSSQSESFRTPEKRTKPPKTKRKKACLACKKSHVVCEGGYPCLRCIKRNIGHLCTEEALAVSSPMTKFNNPNDLYLSAGYKPAFPSNPFMIPSLASVRKGNSLTLSSMSLQSASAAYDDIPIHAEINRSKSISYLPEYSTGHAIVSNSQFFNDNAFTNGSKSYSWNSANSQFQFDSSGLVSGYNPTNANLVTSNSQPCSDSYSISNNSKGSFDNLFSKFIHYFTFKLNMYYTGNGQFQDFWLLEEYRLGLLWPYDFQQRLQSLYTIFTSTPFQSCQLGGISILDRYNQNVFTKIGTANIIDLLRYEELYESVQSLFNRTFSSLTIPSALWRVAGDIGSFSSEFITLLGMENKTEAKKDGMNIFSLLHPESAIQICKYLVDVCEKPDVGPLELAVMIRGRTMNVDYVKCMMNLLVLTDPMKIPGACLALFVPMI